MRHPFQLAVILPFAALAVGCAATISVSSHVDKNVDFSRYHTYEWGPADALPTGDPRLDQNPFFKDHVQGAVERQLTGRGLQLALRPGAFSGADSAPDLLIHYHANITQRFEVNRTDRSYGYCRGGDCPSETVAYEAGTLVIDIIDARTSTLVWRGWAQNKVEDMLRDEDKMAEIIDRAVTQMLVRFPRAL
jgi:hypothetical protein